MFWGVQDSRGLGFRDKLSGVGFWAILHPKSRKLYTRSKNLKPFDKKSNNRAQTTKRSKKTLRTAKNPFRQEESLKSCVLHLFGVFGGSAGATADQPEGPKGFRVQGFRLGAKGLRV